ncbi:S4 domain-containing protein YaaA [Streptococcus ferus]|uniref:S4 domain-containing protein YaaA n=1 Tax=Streptococcus ferus TaxID=1345 RepID=A0A2X3WAG4_9STRE|nr:S4 domain-containing protein YaaA [Streptococcus ferus]SQF41306.1 S4 domain-containing protein YaaA [Streptococcus ferus]
MDYKLFGDYITLQALLKDVGIIQSGGAVKAFLASTEVFFNGQLENRRGKKLRIGDSLSIPSQALTIMIVEPSNAEKEEHKNNLAEKQRIAALVKRLNQTNKTKKGQKNNPLKREKKAVKFPGT